MSSDCFEVRVASMDGTKVRLDVLTLTAGGLTDLCSSRAFALRVLDDALRRAADLVPGRWDTAQGKAEAQRLRAKWEQTALRAALPDNRSDWYVSEAWMRGHVGRFVASCTLVERRNFLSEEELSAREREIEEAVGGVCYTNQHHIWQPMRWQRCHNFTLDVVVTDPRWSEHLEVGLVFPTTAFDVWYE
ncbi:hypothetical protein [Nannocystis radixulma]|uniref:Uncharacterized protein n=1 Tax=Nannocystis radixulma TaxID=2995305 RepID=A0ABT5AZY0_9BACT|nr:hypothetical protein [Nannocystis radixulma]MDC0667053.1 hypothetical protein [Nannocystis radixulma]